MGWFGMGGGSNNPLDKVELDKSQLPSEVEKPASAKDIEKAAQGANVAQTMGQFDALANSMATFNKVVTDMKREGTFQMLTMVNLKTIYLKRGHRSLNMKP